MRPEWVLMTRIAIMASVRAGQQACLLAPFVVAGLEPIAPIFRFGGIDGVELHFSFL